jgi:hypothetical protein
MLWVHSEIRSSEIDIQIPLQRRYYRARYFALPLNHPDIGTVKTVRNDSCSVDAFSFDCFIRKPKSTTWPIS